MSTQPTPAWWENPATDWTKGDPSRLLDILSAAYPPRAAGAAIADRAGFEVSQVPEAPVPVRDAWIWVLNRAAQAHCVPDLIANVVCDPSAADAYPAIAWLLGEALGRAMASLAASGLESASAAEPGSWLAAGAQASTPLQARLIPIQTFGWTIDELRLRTALIRIRGVPVGTGVLVGADLVLTAAHVVGSRNWHLTATGSIVAVFDFTQQPGRSQAEVGTSIRVSEVVCGSPPTASEMAGNVREDWDAPVTYLDYALLRLSTPAPEPAATGMPHAYMLYPEEYGFEVRQNFLLAQCPLGGFVQLSEITNPPRTNSIGTRIRYDCVTFYGSSGGPIVNSDGRLVAIHQYSAQRLKQGVPISAIMEDLMSGPHAHLFNAATVNDVTYLGHYSVTAKDEFCHRIGARWQVVAKALKMPDSMAGPAEMWERLSSSRKLYQLRDTLAKLGYLDLAEILDRDLLNQSHARELVKLGELSAQAGRLRKVVGRGQAATGLLDLIALTLGARDLVRALRTGIDSLPAWHFDQRLQMTWRMSWSAELRGAADGLGSISAALPRSNSDEHQALRDVPIAIARSREVESAITALSELARSWPLVP